MPVLPADDLAAAKSFYVDRCPSLAAATVVPEAFSSGEDQLSSGRLDR